MINIIIWGTGGRAKEILRNFPHERCEIVAFVDNDRDRQKEFHGRPVVNPENISQLDFSQLVIASAFYPEIYQQAISLGVSPEQIFSDSYLYFLTQNSKLSPQQNLCLSRVPWWYHRFEILPGVITPGICGYKPYLLDLPELVDLTNKSALDVGAWDGPYTLEISRRGAKVTAFDIQPSSHSGFDAMREVNELDAKHICENVYNLNPAAHGTYDLVIFFGVYYHLKNPLAAFANINNVLSLDGLLLVEGAILEGAHIVDDHWAKNQDKIKLFCDKPMACYVKGNFQGEWSNWWVPNMTCLCDWISSSGFVVEHCSLVEGGTRCFCVARKVNYVPEEHIVLSSW
jgi:2-polyprenyl-3-methyl-5-hydroxy-6-metoxy-1,4-benzoquinol methylase